MNQLQSLTVVLADGDLSNWGERLMVPPGTEVRYFGTRFERLAELQEHSGTDVNVEGVGEAVNAIADRTLESLRNLDRCVGGGTVRRYWEASDLGERNQLNSGFHFRLCALLAFVERMSLPAALVVVVDDWWFARRLLLTARAAGRVTRATDLTGRVLHFGRLAAGLRRMVTLWKGLRLQWQWLNLQRRQAEAADASSDPPLAADVLRGCDALLVLWGNTHTMQALDNSVPYLGMVPVMLSNLGLRVGFLLMPVDWVEAYADIYRAARDSGRPVVLVPKGIGNVDCIQIGASVLGFALLTSPKLRIDGVDVSGLLRDEILRETQSTRMAHALLLRRVGRWLAQNNLTPKLLVHPYENQSWEKALRSGVRESLPRTQVAGCMHMPFSHRFVSFYPSDKDLTDSQIPDHLLVLGPAVHDAFTAVGFPPERLAIGGAVRMPDWSLALREPAPPCNRTDPSGCVLIATGMSHGECLELVGKALAAILSLPVLRAVVNFHPQVGTEFRNAIRHAALRRVGVDDVCRIEFSDAGVHALLPRVDAVIYNVSAAAFDALVAGVPTIFVCSEVAVDLDKLPPGTGLKARSPAEIRSALETLNGKSRDQLLHAARKNCSAGFSPVTIEPWGRLVGEITRSPGPNPAVI